MRRKVSASCKVPFCSGVVLASGACAVHGGLTREAQTVLEKTGRNEHQAAYERRRQMISRERTYSFTGNLYKQLVLHLVPTVQEKIEAFARLVEYTTSAVVLWWLERRLETCSFLGTPVLAPELEEKRIHRFCLQAREGHVNKLVKVVGPSRSPSIFVREQLEWWVVSGRRLDA